MFTFSFIRVTIDGDRRGLPVTGVVIPPGPLATELGAPVGEGIWAVGEDASILLLRIRRRGIIIWAP